MDYFDQVQAEMDAEKASLDSSLESTNAYFAQVQAEMDAEEEAKKAAAEKARSAIEAKNIRAAQKASALEDANFQANRNANLTDAERSSLLRNSLSGYQSKNDTNSALFSAGKSSGEAIGGAVKGAGKAIAEGWTGDAEFEELPALWDTPEWKRTVGKGGKAANLISGDRGTANIFLGANEGAGYGTKEDANGNLMITNSAGTPIGYANKPGMDMQDAARIGIELGVTAIPVVGVAAKAAQAGRLARMSMIAGTEVAADSALQSLASAGAGKNILEGWDPLRTIMAATTGPLAEAGGLAVQAFRSKLAKGSRIARGKEIASKLNLSDPEGVMTNERAARLSDIYESMAKGEEGILKYDIDPNLRAAIADLELQNIPISASGGQATFGNSALKREAELSARGGSTGFFGKNKLAEQADDNLEAVTKISERNLVKHDLNTRDSLSSAIKSGEARKGAVNERYSSAVEALDSKFTNRKVFSDMDEKAQAIFADAEQSGLFDAFGKTKEMKRFRDAWQKYATKQAGPERDKSLKQVVDLSEDLNQLIREAPDGKVKRMFQSLRGSFDQWEKEYLPTQVGKESREALSEFNSARSRYRQHKQTYTPQFKGDSTRATIESLTKGEIEPKNAIAQIFGKDAVKDTLTRKDLVRVLKATPPKMRGQARGDIKQLIDQRTFGTPSTGNAGQGTIEDVKRIQTGLRRLIDGDLKDVAGHVFSKKEIQEKKNALAIMDMLSKAEKAHPTQDASFYVRTGAIGGLRTVLGYDDLVRHFNSSEVKEMLKPLLVENPNLLNRAPFLAAPTAVNQAREE